MIMDRNETPQEPHHLGVPSASSKTISKPRVRLAQIVPHLAPTLTPSPNGPKQDLLWPTSIRSSIRCVQNDFWAHATFSANCAPYVNFSAISKWSETSFPLSLVTYEYHRVRPKQFMSLWYIWRKICAYLSLTLTPSLNVPNWDSTRATSPRSSIGCIQNDFQAFGTFGVNYAPILHQD
jgi:hypothetical protein